LTDEELGYAPEEELSYPETVPEWVWASNDADADEANAEKEGSVQAVAEELLESPAEPEEAEEVAGEIELDEPAENDDTDDRERQEM
jgi:hypothetical protein